MGDLNALAALQAELREAEAERTALLQAAVIASSNDEQPGSDQDHCSPRLTPTSNSQPAPPARKVLSWGTPRAPCSRDQTLKHQHPPPTAYAHKDGTQSHTRRATSSRPPRTRLAAPQHSTLRASSAGTRRHAPVHSPSSVSSLEASGATGSGVGAPASSGAEDPNSVQPAASHSGPSAPATAAGNGTDSQNAVSEEGVRRAVLREVLAAMLGPHAAHKADSYQLDVQTVAAVAQQRGGGAASQASQPDAGAVAALRAAKEQAERVATDAKARAERELAAVKLTAEEERTQLRRKLEASRKEAETLGKEKRDLLARLGQQGRDARAASSAQQEVQDRIAGLEKQLSSQQRATANAQKSLEHARADHKASIVTLEAKLATAMEEAERTKKAGAKQAAESAREASQQIHRACSQVQANSDAALEHATLSMASACQEVSALSSLLQTLQEEHAQQHLLLQQQLDGARQELAGVRPCLKEELEGLQKDARTITSQLEDRCCALATQCTERVQALLQLDAQIAALGPEGIERLNREVREAQQRQADAETEARQQAIKLAGVEASRSALANEKHVQGTELALLVEQQAELKRGLAEVKRELAASKGRNQHAHTQIVGLTERATQLAQQVEQLEQRHRELEAAAGAAEAEAAGCREKVVRVQQQREVVEERCRALEEAAARMADQAASAYSVGAQHAAAAAAQQVRELKDKFFRMPVGVPPHPHAYHHHHQQQQQQQQQQDAIPEHAQGPPQGIASSGTPAAAAEQPAASTSAPNPSFMTAAAPTGLAASASCEDSYGLRLCRLSHTSITAAFEEYTQRQAAHTDAGSSDGAYQGDVDGASGGADARSSGETREGEQLVAAELLWLEGCLLLHLVESRQEQVQAQQRQQQLQEQQQRPQGGQQEANEQQAAHGPRAAPESSGAGEMAAQMMRSMARERRQLQQRVQQLEALVSTSRPPSAALPSPLYLPATLTSNTTTSTRRSLSAHAHVSSAPLKPSLSSTKQAQQPDSSATLSAGLLAAAPSAAGGTGAAVTAPLPAGSTGTAVMAPSAAGGTGAAVVASRHEDDDVWQVLDALQECSLRSSRGMHGLHSAGSSATTHSSKGRRTDSRDSACTLTGMGSRRAPSMTAAAAAARPPRSLHSGGRPGAMSPQTQALTPGQAFVAKHWGNMGTAHKLPGLEH